MANSVKSYKLNQDKTLENNESNFIVNEEKTNI